MINQNRVSKYLLYAIGEIILVVLGILIALQINTWDQTRREIKSENYYLERLLTNLKQDSLELQIQLYNIQQMEKKIDAIIVGLTSSQDFESSNFANNAIGLLQTVYFNQNDAVYRNLITSGKIELIKNPEITESLFSYYDPAKIHRQWDDANVAYTRNEFGPYLLDNGEVDLEGNFGLTNKYDFLSRLAMPEKAIDSYKSDRKLINIIRFKILLISSQAAIYRDSILPENERLRNLIESEIDKHH